MENIIDNKLQRLIPYLRGFFYDEKTLLIRINLLIPNNWNYLNLKEKGIIVNAIKFNDFSNTLIIGLGEEQLHDKPFDYFCEEIEKMIAINQEKSKKQELLNQKIKELQNFIDQSSLDEINNLKMIPLNNVSVSQDDIIEHVIENNSQDKNEELEQNIYQQKEEFIENTQPLSTIDDNIINVLQNVPFDRERDEDIPFNLNDGEISYNPNMDLPPDPAIIDDINFFKNFEQ